MRQGFLDNLFTVLNLRGQFVFLGRRGHAHVAQHIQAQSLIVILRFGQFKNTGDGIDVGLIGRVIHFNNFI